MNAKHLLLAILLLTTPLAYAQYGQPSGPGGPSPMHDRGFEHDGGPQGGERGMWWKNPEVVTRIGLTPDQQKKIDDLFLQSRVQLIDLHATLEKEQLLLDPLINANPVDQPKAIAQIDKIADTRASLEKTNAKMLLSIRGVLTPDQWTKLRAAHDDTHGHEGGPGNMHKGPGGGPHRDQQKPAAPPAPPAE